MICDVSMLGEVICLDKVQQPLIRCGADYRNTEATYVRYIYLGSKTLDQFLDQLLSNLHAASVGVRRRLMRRGAREVLSDLGLRSDT